MERSASIASTVVRLLPARTLPPYSYVSGKFPHPLRDPGGHSYGREEPPASLRSEIDWPQCEAYLWGIDLFNLGYYWEAHESWEALWHAAGRRGPLADFVKALIKLAAAGVKAREGRTDGVRRHATRARQLVESVAKEFGRERRRVLGLRLSTLSESTGELVHNPGAIVNTSDEPVVAVMPFQLNPAEE